MTFPFSKEELQFVSELQDRFKTDVGTFSTGEYQQFYDIFTALETRRIILDASSINKPERVFYLIGNLDGFIRNVTIEDEKARKLSQREWKIAIVAAIIGAIAGQLPAIIRIIGGLVNAN